MKFTKTFDTENFANIYQNGKYKLPATALEDYSYKYEIYRERTYKNNGASKCDGDWIVQIMGNIDASFKTLKEAKNYCIFNEMF